VNMDSFNKDYKEGREIEEKILKVVRKKYPKAKLSDGNVPEFDLFIPEISKTVEIKFDRLAEKTGNFVIEVEFDDRPSGLEGTTADFWLIYFNKVAYLLETESLRYLVRESKRKRFVFGGFEKKSKLVLIPVEEIIFSAYTVEWKVE